MWKKLGSVSPGFAHVVNLAMTQGATKRYVDLKRKKHPFNSASDLVAFCLWGCENAARLHTDASADGIYRALGHGLKRVGIKFEPDKIWCGVGRHRDDLTNSENPWRLVHIFSDDTSDWWLQPFCDGPCRAALRRYVCFFRDADVLYI